MNTALINQVLYIRNFRAHHHLSALLWPSQEICFRLPMSHFQGRMDDGRRNRADIELVQLTLLAASPDSPKKMSTTLYRSCHPRMTLEALDMICPTAVCSIIQSRNKMYQLVWKSQSPDIFTLQPCKRYPAALRHSFLNVSCCSDTLVIIRTGTLMKVVGM